MNCWQVFQCLLPRRFPKVTEGFIPITPSNNYLLCSTNLEMDNSALGTKWASVPTKKNNLKI